MKNIQKQEYITDLKEQVAKHLKVDKPIGLVAWWFGSELSP
jgi:hypothetical protein